MHEGGHSCGLSSGSCGAGAGVGGGAAALLSAVQPARPSLQRSRVRPWVWLLLLLRACKGSSCALRGGPGELYEPQAAGLAACLSRLLRERPALRVEVGEDWVECELGVGGPACVPSSGGRRRGACRRKRGSRAVVDLEAELCLGRGVGRVGA